MINGLSGGAGISTMSNIRSCGLLPDKREGDEKVDVDDNVREEREAKENFRSFRITSDVSGNEEKGNH